MALQYDWGLDADGDIDLENNDLTYKLSDTDHIEDNIKSFPLWWKQFPADGVGIKSYLNSPNLIQKAMGAIKKQLQQDGYVCNNPIITIDGNGTYTIDPQAMRL